MKKQSISRKLLVLCSTLLFLIILIGSFGYYGGHILTEKLYDAHHTQLPAIRNMTLADMMHDGLRAIVFRALYISAQGGDVEQKTEIAEELKEFSESMNKYISEIDHLNIPSATKVAINEVKPQIEFYLKATEEIVGLALTQQLQLAHSKVNDFQKAFKSLEGKMEVLGELIEKDSEVSSASASASAESFNIINTALVLFGLIVGTIISLWIGRSLIKTLSNIIDDLSKITHQVSTVSSQSASSATELSEASTEQAASLQETMASIEEISAMVAQNAESAVKVMDSVNMNRSASEEGSNSVVEMMHSIDEIKTTNDQILQQMETSNKEFGNIVQIISEIGDKTKVINDIVFQTKLLSFNASVEAARAGEHGKGFAVVAEEVGNLAQMSGNAAKEITDMLTDSIKKVNEIVESTRSKVDQLVDVGRDKITMGQSIAQKCRDTLTKIAESAQTVSTMVSEITHASKEQSQGVQEINKAIGQLDQVTQQNSAVAQQSSTQAEQLSVEAQNLSKAVNTLATFINGVGEHSSPTPVALVNNVVAMNKKPKLTTVPVALKKVSGERDVESNVTPKFEDF